MPCARCWRPLTPVPAAADDRTSDQRRAAALGALAQLGLNCPSTGAGRTVRPRIGVLVSHETMQNLTDRAIAVQEGRALPGLAPDLSPQSVAKSPQLEDGTPIPRDPPRPARVRRGIEPVHLRAAVRDPGCRPGGTHIHPGETVGDHRPRPTLPISWLHRAAVDLGMPPCKALRPRSREHVRGQRDPPVFSPPQPCPHPRHRDPPTRSAVGVHRRCRTRGGGSAPRR
jgi:hypothetical protein